MQSKPPVLDRYRSRMFLSSRFRTLQSSDFFSSVHRQALHHPRSSNEIRGRVDIFKQLVHQNTLERVSILFMFSLVLFLFAVRSGHSLAVSVGRQLMVPTVNGQHLMSGRRLSFRKLAGVIWANSGQAREEGLINWKASNEQKDLSCCRPCSVRRPAANHGY